MFLEEDGHEQEMGITIPHYDTGDIKEDKRLRELHLIMFGIGLDEFWAPTPIPKSGFFFNFNFSEYFFSKSYSISDKNLKFYLKKLKFK